VPKQKRSVPKVVRSSLLGLRDPQLLVGCSMILTAFIKIPYKSGDMGWYHLVVVSDIAWLSSNVPLLAIIILRSYFYKKAFWGKVRYGAMIILALGLIVDSVFIGDKDSNDKILGCPALCVIADPLSVISGVPSK